MKCRSGTPKRGGFYEPLRARLQFYNPRVLISRMNEEEVVRRDEIEKARFLVRSRIRSYKLFLEIDDSKRLWKIRLRRRKKQTFSSGAHIQNMLRLHTYMSNGTGPGFYFAVLARSILVYAMFLTAIFGVLFLAML